MLVLAAIGLSACATKEPEPPPAPATPPALSTQVLNKWLNAAQTALDEGRLTYPRENSALAVYQFILSRNPGQKEALRGLEHIVEVHIEQAMQALDKRQLASARSMLARAKLILPDHPSIEPTAEQIRLISEAERTVVKLSAEVVNARELQLEKVLQPVAELPGDRSCRFNIWAPSDGQARKIYRALSNRATLLAGVPIERLRAQISIRSPAAVERLCFAHN